MSTENQTRNEKEKRSNKRAAKTAIGYIKMACKQKIKI